MRSSSSAPALRAGVVAEGVLVSAWDLSDIRSGSDADALGIDERRFGEAAAHAAAQELAEAEREREAAALREAELRAAEEQERRVREAFEQGYEEGRRDGEIAEGARLRTAVRATEEALDELRSSEVRWTGSIEENICALAVAIARHIVGRELSMDAKPVLTLVRDALTEFPIDQPIRIRISPGDLQLLRQTDEDEDPMGTLTQGRDARWIGDPQVAPGGCVVEGRERIVDGRVDTALERIYRRLTYTHA